MKSWALPTALVMACAAAAVAAANSSRFNPREARDADRYIIWDLARQISPAMRKARDHCDSCGDEGAGIETAIGLLGVGGQATTDGLLNLLAVQLDAGTAEEMECQIAKRGRALVPALKAFNSARAASWCRASFLGLRKQELSNVTDVRMEQVCRPSNEIEKDRTEWIRALSSGRNLFEESGPC